MILKVKDKEYSFTATMKKIVGINNKLKVKNLRDAFFKALNNVDFEFLANLLMALIDDDYKKELNGDSNKVYDLMESWVNENNTDYEALYKEVAKEINDKSFFGKKMTEEELEAQMNNPLADFDINQVISNTAEKVMGEVVAEEFKGYKG